jgi:adenosylmethionine-8-amino-7-oxononanoate aminotransferase
LTRTNPEFSALWHPFADMGAVEHEQLVITRGEGAWVWDDAGKRYLDGTASLWYANLGHGIPEIADAVAAQLRKLDAYSIFGDFGNEPALELADRLSGLSPEPGSRVFLGSGGADMIDTAGKIARSFHVQEGHPDRVHLISREQGYHGTHGLGTSIQGIPANTVGFGQMIPDTSRVPHDDADALEQEILRVGPDKVAAFFCEPVIGAGGVILPKEGYIEAVAEICRRHGVLFIADCVICGFGRLGTWLGIDRWPVKPDMITLAKGVTGGTMPLGALIVAPRVAEPFFTRKPGAPVLRHGATYAGHPAACVAANVALQIYERDNLIERGRTLEKPLADALAPAADHELVSEVRAGLGFLAAVEIAPEWRERDATLVPRLVMACRSRGVLVRPLAQGIAVSPPLVCDTADVELIGSVINEGLNSLEPALAQAG